MFRLSTSAYSVTKKGKTSGLGDKRTGGSPQLPAWWRSISEMRGVWKLNPSLSGRPPGGPQVTSIATKPTPDLLLTGAETLWDSELARSMSDNHKIMNNPTDF